VVDEVSDFPPALPPLGLRIFEAAGLDISDLREEHGHRVLHVVGKGGRIPPSRCRQRSDALLTTPSTTAAMGPCVLNARGTRMDRHAATRRLHRLAAAAGVHLPRMPGMLRHTYVTTMLDAGIDLRDVHIAARHADPRTTTRRRHLSRRAIVPTSGWVWPAVIKGQQRRLGYGRVPTGWAQLWRRMRGPVVAPATDSDGSCRVGA
jgi:integrase